MGTAAAIRSDDDLSRALAIVKTALRGAWGLPLNVETPLGMHGVTWGEDESGEYATIGMVLPYGVYAEIEDGTYGQMQAFRIYREDLP